MVKAIVSKQEPQPTKYDYVITETGDGFVVTQPAGVGGFLPTLRWQVDIYVDGSKKQECTRPEFGFMQNLLSADAIVKWQRGTTWRWYSPKLPARDALDGRSPWYADGSPKYYGGSPKYVTSATGCKQSVTIEFGDPPDLKARGTEKKGVPGYTPKGNPDFIPWDDPITGAKDTVTSLRWTYKFEVYVVARISSKEFVPLVGRTWQLNVLAFFDCTQPINHRHTLGYSTVTVWKYVSGSLITHGPLAQIRITQSR